MKIQPGHISVSNSSEQNKFPQANDITKNHQNVNEMISEKDRNLFDSTTSSFQPNEQALQSILSGTGIAFSALGDIGGKSMRLTDSKLPLPRRITITGRNSLFYPRRQRVENLSNETNQYAKTEQITKDTQSLLNFTDAIPEREIKDKENQSILSPNSKEDLSMRPQPQAKQDEELTLEPSFENTTTSKTELASELNKSSQHHKNKGRAKGKEQKEQETEVKQSSKDSYYSEQYECSSTGVSPQGAYLSALLSNGMSSASHDWKYFGTVIRQLLDLHSNDEKRIKELEHENVLLLNRITNCEREAASEREITRKEIQQLHTELSKSESEIRKLQEELRLQRNIYKEETESLRNQVEMLQNKTALGLDKKAISPLNVVGESETNEYNRDQQRNMKMMGEDSKVSATSSDIDYQQISKKHSTSSKLDNLSNHYLEMTTSSSTNNKWEQPQVHQSTASCSPCSTKHSINSQTPSPSNRGKLFREPERDIFNQTSEVSNTDATRLDHSGYRELQKPIQAREGNLLSTSFEVQPQSLQQILSCEAPISSQTSRDATRYMSFYDPTFRPHQSGKSEGEDEPDWRRLTLTAETPNRCSISKSTETPSISVNQPLESCDALLSSLRDELRGPRYRNMRDAWQNLFKPTCNRLKPSLFYQAIRKIPAGKQVSQDVLDELFQRIVPAAKETPKDLWEGTIAMGWEHFVRLYQGNLQR